MREGQDWCFGLRRVVVMQDLLVLRSGRGLGRFFSALFLLCEDGRICSKTVRCSALEASQTRSSPRSVSSTPSSRARSAASGACRVVSAPHRKASVLRLPETSTKRISLTSPVPTATLQTTGRTQRTSVKTQRASKELNEMISTQARRVPLRTEQTPPRFHRSI